MTSRHGRVTRVGTFCAWCVHTSRHAVADVNDNIESQLAALLKQAGYTGNIWRHSGAKVGAAAYRSAFDPPSTLDQLLLSSCTCVSRR
jgi:hypothetical protein